MVAKRKRESSVTSSNAIANGNSEAGPSSAIATTPQVASKSDRKGKGKQVDLDTNASGQGPRVLYSTAEGSKSWKKHLDLERDYSKTLKHIAKKLGLPKGESSDLRLAHVRDGGREVEIWDDFDYQAFKSRAMASPGDRLSLKIYGAGGAGEFSVEDQKVGRSQDTQGGPSAAPTPTSTSKPRPASTTRDQPMTQSAGQSSHPSKLTKAPKAPRSKSKPKTTSTTQPPAVNIESQNPLPATSPTPLTKAARRQTEKRARKRKSLDSTASPSSSPSPAPASAPSTPSPLLAGPAALLRFTDKYKPARPSPLGPNRLIVPPVVLPAAKPQAEAKSADTPKTRKRERRRERRARRSELPDGTTPGSTPQKQDRVSKQSGNEGGREKDQSPPKKRARQQSIPANGISDPEAESQARTLVPSAPATSDGSSAPTDVSGAKKKTKGKAVKRDSLATGGQKQDIVTPEKPASHVSEATATVDESAPSSTDVNGDVSMSDTTAAAPEAPALSAQADASTQQRAPATIDTSAKKQKAQAKPARGKKAAPSTESAETPSPALDTQAQEAVPSSSKKAAPKTSKAKKAAVPVEPPASSEAEPQTEISSSLASVPETETTPSSEPTPPTPLSTKKGKAPRKKAAEAGKPSMIQAILQKQRERVAAEAEAAAKASAGATGSAASPTSQAVLTTSPPGSDASDFPAQESTANPVTTPTIESDGLDTALASEDAAQSQELEPERDPAVSTDNADIEMGDLEAIERTPEPAEDVEMGEVSESPTLPETQDSESEVIAAVPADDMELVPETVASEPTAQIIDPEPAAPANDEVAIPETVLPVPAAPNATASSATPKTKAKAPPAKGRKSKTKEVPCTICLRTPWHFQKDCPEVKEGAENLRYLLSARQDQHNSIADGVDGESHFEQSIELIQEWIERLEKIAGKVQGVPGVEKGNTAFRPRSPIGILGDKDGRTYDLNAQSPTKNAVARKDKARSKDLEVAVEKESELASSAEDIVLASPESTDAVLPAVPDDDDGDDSLSPPSSMPAPAQRPSSVTSSVVTPPESPALVPDTFNFPPIHLKAMQKSRRTGSTSGLSVSDAYIETEPSDDSSSDDDDDEDDRGADEISGAESDASTSSSSSIVSSDSDDDDSAESTTSRVPMPSNPSEAITFSLTRELSEREKKKARLSAAKMQPVAFDEVSVIDEDEDQDEDDQAEEGVSPPAPTPARLPRARADSDSSIGDFGDDASRRSSMSEEEITSRRQAPPLIIASSSVTKNTLGFESDAEDDDLSAPEREASTTPPAEPVSIDVNPEPVANSIDSATSKSSRSFCDIEGIAASSPELDDSAGLHAVQQGIADEEESTVADEEEVVVPEPLVPTQSLSQARRSRRQSTQASTAESVEPVVTAGPASAAASGTRRSSRTSAPPRETPARRLRSASREIPEKTPPPPSRSTRSVSRSRTSMSPSVGLRSPAPATPRARRVSKSVQPDTDGPEQETPKQTVGRTTRRSQSTQAQADTLDSSLPVIQETDSSQSQTYPSALDAQTQSTPVRRSSRTSPSPLFMTQGSQIPATQFYNPLPETIPEEEVSSPPSSAQPSREGRGKVVGNGQGTSPLAEAEEEVSARSEDSEEEVETTPRAGALHISPRSPKVNGHAMTDDLESVNGNDNDDIEMSDAQSQASDVDMDADADADADAEDDDNDSIPDIPLPSIRRPAASQPIIPSGGTQYTGLSALPLDFLRSARTFITGGGGKPSTPTPASGRNGNGNGHAKQRAESDDDSGDSSDSSTGEVEPPSALKGRFVSGGVKKKAASQPMSW